jgi:tetratricopeptide (TPR) repeat protein
MANEDKVIFLQLPPTMAGSLPVHEHHHEGEEAEAFNIDPSIPLPVELSGEVYHEEGHSPLENLNWEMILAGILRVLASPASFVDAEGRSPSEERLDYYRRFVLSLRPHLLTEFNSAAVVKMKNGDYSGAMEILDCLIGLAPGLPATLYNRALTYEAWADAVGEEEKEGCRIDEEAEKAWDALLALDPPHIQGLFNAGFFYVNRQNYVAAAECFTRFIRFTEDAAPDSPRLARLRSEARAELNNIERNNLDDRNFAEAYELVKEGSEEAGLGKAEEFLEEHGDAWNGWFLKGWALRRLGRWEEGAEAFSKALELAGEKAKEAADILNERAICLMELGDLKGARNCLEAALRREGENVKIISNLGVLALKRGDSDEAASFFRTVLDIDPKDPIARQYLDML